MTITHTYLETRDLLDSFHSYGWKEHRRDKDWETKQLSFRQLKAGNMDERSIIQLFVKSPKVPKEMKRRFSCICADRIFNNFYQYEERERCVERALELGWDLAWGKKVRRTEIRKIRAQTQQLMWVLRCEPLYVWNVLETIRAVLIDDAIEAAKEASQNAYDAMMRSHPRPAVDAEQRKQINSIINLTEGRLVLQRIAPSVKGEIAA